jgi:hypothetical protein
MKALLVSLMICLGFAGNAMATEYIYRDLMANTLPSVCAKASEARIIATKDYTVDKYSRRFCQSQGYGWHVEAIKEKGNLVCNDCANANSSGKKQCHLDDVVVTCKRIKPGSVGMLPGKG